jgi:hypothetical protein
LAAAAVALIALTTPSNAQQATTKKQLIGSWKARSLKATTGSNVSYPLGENVAGYMTITSDRISLLFVHSTRKVRAAAALTDAESIAMMRSHVAWSGKYTTAEQTADGIKLTARVDAASNEAIANTDRVYLMQVNGNKLIVKSPGVIVPVTGVTSVVEFETVKADWSCGDFHSGSIRPSQRTIADGRPRSTAERRADQQIPFPACPCRKPNQTGT